MRAASSGDSTVIRHCLRAAVSRVGAHVKRSMRVASAYDRHAAHSAGVKNVGTVMMGGDALCRSEWSSRVGEVS